MSEIPLIFTTKGNIPVSELKQDVEWRFNAGCIVFIERYFLGDEMVKESSHAKLLSGVAAIGATGKIGE